MKRIKNLDFSQLTLDEPIVQAVYDLANEGTIGWAPLERVRPPVPAGAGNLIEPPWPVTRLRTRIAMSEEDIAAYENAARIRERYFQEQAAARVKGIDRPATSAELTAFATLKKYADRYSAVGTYIRETAQSLARARQIGLFGLSGGPRPGPFT